MAATVLGAQSVFRGTGTLWDADFRDEGVVETSAVTATGAGSVGALSQVGAVAADDVRRVIHRKEADYARRPVKARRPSAPAS